MSFSGKPGSLTLSELIGLATSGENLKYLVIKGVDQQFSLRCESGKITGIHSDSPTLTIQDILLYRKQLTKESLEKIPESLIGELGLGKALVESGTLSSGVVQLARYHLAESIFFQLLEEESGSFNLETSGPEDELLFDIGFRDWVSTMLPDIAGLQAFRNRFQDFDQRLFWVSPLKFDSVLDELSMSDIKLLSRYQPRITVRNYWYSLVDAHRIVSDSLTKLNQLEIILSEAPKLKPPNSRPFLRRLLVLIIEKLEAVQELIGQDGEVLSLLHSISESMAGAGGGESISTSADEDVSLDDLSSITSSIEDILDMNGISDLNLDTDISEPEAKLVIEDVAPSGKSREIPKKMAASKSRGKSKSKTTKSSLEDENKPESGFESLEEKVEAKVRHRKFISNVTMAYNRMNLRNITYFDMLGVAPNADRKKIHKAFVKAIKQINPSGIRIDRRTDQEVLDKAVEIRDKLKIAYQTLINKKTKRQYVASLRESREEKERKKLKAMALFNQGMAEFKSGHFDKAREIFRQAVAYDPNSPVYYTMLESITQEERLTNSSKFFQAGILAFKQKNDSNRAIKLIKKAISMTPGHASYHIKLAEIQSSRAETRRDAIKNYEIAIELDPGNHELRITLADFLNSCGFKQEAANRYQEILKWIPDHTKVRKELLLFRKEGIRPQKVQAEDRDGDDEE